MNRSENYIIFTFLVLVAAFQTQVFGQKSETSDAEIEPINDDQRCRLVLAKDRKQWKLLSEHCTRIVNKQSLTNQFDQTIIKI